MGLLGEPSSFSVISLGPCQSALGRVSGPLSMVAFSLDLNYPGQRLLLSLFTARASHTVRTQQIAIERFKVLMNLTAN